MPVLHTQIVTFFSIPFEYQFLSLKTSSSFPIFPMNKRKIITHMSQLGSQSDPLQNDSDFSSKIAIYRMKILDKKPLLIPGYIDDISHYEACGLLEFFKIQGWMHLLTNTYPIYLELVKRFYVNFKRNPEIGILSSQLKGHVITLDENFLARLLNIPAQG